jgi:hypothetical protein
MIIPLPFSWGRQHSITQQDQIERAIENRNYRLIAGLSIEGRFEQISAVLLVSIGHGKFIRCRHIIESSSPIPGALRKGCLEFVSGTNNDCGQLSSLLVDLAAVQATAVDRLKLEAGKYVDRILAVSILDPGIWRIDFDGRQTYGSFCDATRLAELSGVTVIDHFPAADLSAGGSGRNLEALPFWLLAADRSERVSVKEKLILSIGSATTLLKLPSSDGRDIELPPFESWQLQGNRFVPTSHHPSADTDLAPSEVAIRSDLPSPSQLREALEEILLQIAQIGPQGAPVEVILICDEVRAQETIGCIVGHNPKVTAFHISKLGVSAQAVKASMAALLGLMHIDQFPANVPWLTGANSQRILGRLTLGRPSNWRQLVRTMADYHPAAMKLKDAI